MSLIIETAYGRIQGVNRGGHRAFLGIPYAKAPTGRLRFLPPQPPEPWAGVRAATVFGPSAPQPESPVAGAGAEGRQDEDCLYLNVFAPSTDGPPRPVLLWIHGGAFVQGSGSSALFDGKNLCERGQVVVVTINYRLGALGFAAFGGEATKRWGARANLGLLDQVQALKWVRENIASFGGNARNVTAFGESAGAMSVCTLMTMPSTAGLFNRAIAQSGAVPQIRADGDSRDTTLELLRELGIDPARSEEIQRVDVKRLLGAQAEVDARAKRWAGYGPVVDGNSLPEPVRAAFARGRAMRVPLLIGSNRDEWNLFEAPRLMQEQPPIDDAKLIAQLESQLAKAVHREIPKLVDGYRESRARLGLRNDQHAIRRAILGDYRFRLPVIRVAEAHSGYEPRTFVYLFAYCSPALRGRLGACHALELAFVFGTLDAPFQDRFAGTGPVVRSLSGQMMRSWLSFAHNDTPNGSPSDQWSPYDAGARKTMVFDRESRVAPAPLDAERALWDSVAF